MRAVEQLSLGFASPCSPPPQLLKWVGNKHRSASIIAGCVLDEGYRRYIEPFVGTGAVLGALAPESALAADALKPLIDIWLSVQADPQALVQSYASRWQRYQADPRTAYAAIRKQFNLEPNSADLLFLCRSCYGGVVRFTMNGTMSTPVGVHRPIHPSSLLRRALLWQRRVLNTSFLAQDFEQTMEHAGHGDVVYCDPPYSFAQSILYGAQGFSLGRLFSAIESCVKRGARVLLSLDGSKRSGRQPCCVLVPDGLFRREMSLDQGSSMLRRFQKRGQEMIGEDVSDRLLLTW